MPEDHLDITAAEASEMAAHKAKSAQAAVELAREVHQMELVGQTKTALMEALKEVFGDSDNPGQMNILVRRIPLICQDVQQIHKDIASINDSLKWGVRLVIGAVILGIISSHFTNLL